MANKPGADPRGGHLRLYWDLLDSNAWRCLSAADQRTYIALLRGLKGSNNGDLSLALSVAKHHGIKSQTTLAKSLRALCAVGLIAVTRKGGCKRGGQRLATLYRITDTQVFDMPAKHITAVRATNDWKAITTLSAGMAAIRDAEVQAKGSAKTKSLVQKLVVTTPINGLVEPLTSPKIGVWPS